MSVWHSGDNDQDYLDGYLFRIDNIHQSRVSKENSVKENLECHLEKNQSVPFFRAEGESIVEVSTCQHNIKILKLLKQYPFNANWRCYQNSCSWKNNMNTFDIFIRNWTIKNV